MTRKQVRKIVFIVVLVLILAALIGYFSYYRSTKKLTFDLAASVTGGAIAPPEFLFSFSGTENLRIQRPLGILVDQGKVFVSDGVRHTIYIFDESGKQLSSFGSQETSTPLYIARNPINGNLYVTDRGARRIEMFTTSGQYLGVFDPKLPKKQLPKFKTYGAQWIPVAIGFADDGSMYVTEILNGHRLLIFNPAGKFVKSVGTAGIAKAANLAAGYFQFPNALMVVGKEVYIADSNNGRIQVFDLTGKFKRFVVTQGLPRGVAQLDRFSSDTTQTPGRFVEVDTLSHDATIWTDTGQKLVTFGTQGVLDGQFSYPSSVAKGSKNRIFITDTANARVQVWGWPEQVSPVAALVQPSNAWMCLLPLLLIPIIFLTRRRRFVATPDFVIAMIGAENEDLMPGGRRRWLATETDYEKIKKLDARNVNMEELFEGTEVSESDARAIAEKLEVDKKTSFILALATRSKVFCTESLELRRLAKMLEIDAIDTEEFVRRYPRGSKPRHSDDKTAS